MKTIFLIALGGGCGAVFRYLLSRCVQSFFGLSFPFGTLLVNIIGSFLIGFLGWLLLERVGGLAMPLRALLIIGLLGGFTTFSSFSYESIALFESRELVKMGLYIVLSVALCLVATWCGLTFGRKI